jgi:hypothetical protein
MGPSDSLFSFSRKLRSSLALGLPRDGYRISLRGSLARRALQTHPFVCIARGDGFYRLPVWPGHTRGRRQGLPGFWIVLFTRAAANYPAGCMSLSPIFFCERHAMAFQKDQPLGTRNRNNFVAGTPRLIVSRTYASTRSLPAALQDSLPTRLGSVLIGRDSHPLDDKLDFRKNRILLPSRPALPGRNDPVV